MDYNHDGFYSQAFYYDILFGWDRSSEFLFMDSTFQRHGLHVGSSLLEVACGTGVAGIQLQALGWVTSGVDISENMLKLMDEHATRAGRHVPNLCADMRDFKLTEKVDGAFCPLGSIGLLHEDQDLVSHFRSCAHNLNENGLYLIDLGLNPKGTALCDIESIEWGMEVDGIVVEALDGMVRVDDPVHGVIDQFEWEGVPLEFEWSHFVRLVEASESFDIEAFYPESGQTEEGISLFSADREGFEPECERAMVLLRRK
jgi:SAM-dependent methyltransferase